MHLRRNCQRHVWLLSGTGEGPKLAKTLIQEGWSVTVSVVSLQASMAYSDLSLEKLKIGFLDGVKEIVKVLEDSEIDHEGFDWVLDATHPFAELISSSLREACEYLSQPLVRYERPQEDVGKGTLISDLRDLASFDLKDQRILMAIGSRSLNDAVLAARSAGAEVFARVLPSPESLKKALSSSLPSNHLALFRPRSDPPFAMLEMALCRRWSITGVVCRQSGGITEAIWRTISQTENLDLWLVARPAYSDQVETFNSFEKIISRITR
tara:strand:+ start:886 stop:1686 length:801 start_codon:yes stop_codon:yes gene_type:complete